MRIQILLLCFLAITVNSYGQISFTEQELFSTSFLSKLAVTNFNNDGIPDMAANSFGSDKILIFTSNNQGYDSQEFSIEDPSELNIADYENDGDHDLFVMSRTGQYFFKNIGNVEDPNIELHASYMNGSSNTAFTVGNYDNKDGVDMIAGSTGLKRLYLLRDENFEGHSTSIMDNSGIDRPGELHSTDLDGDGTTEVIYTDFFDDYISIYTYNLTTESFDEERIENSIDSPIAANTADFNGDNIQDIVVSSFSGAKLFLYLSDDGGSYQKLEIANQVSELTKLNIGDLDLDGDMDILGYKQNSKELILFQNNDLTFINSPIVSNQMFSSTNELVDYDSDGDLDIIAHAEGIVYLLLNSTTILSSHEQIDFDANIYPNPFVSELQISTNSKDLNYTLFSLDGRFITNLKNGNNKLDHLVNGMYILKVESKLSGVSKNVSVIKK